jgi:hypothetical protein
MLLLVYIKEKQTNALYLGSICRKKCMVINPRLNDIKNRCTLPFQLKSKGILMQIRASSHGRKLVVCSGLFVITIWINGLLYTNKKM